MSNYIINNDTVDVLSENCITILKNLPAKIYTINAGPQGQMFLKEHNFIFNNRKIYGDLNNKVQRIFKTYESRDKNLGVLLSGLKGTGKSLLIKLCIERAIEDDKIAEGFIKEYPDKKFRNSIKYQNSYI